MTAVILYMITIAAKCTVYIFILTLLSHFAAIVIIYNMTAVILSKQIHAVNDSHGYTVSQSIYLHYSLHYKTME